MSFIILPVGVPQSITIKSHRIIDLESGCSSIGTTTVVLLNCHSVLKRDKRRIIAWIFIPREACHSLFVEQYFLIAVSPYCEESRVSSIISAQLFDSIIIILPVVLL